MKSPKIGSMVGLGHSWVEVEISDLRGRKKTKVKALVDTGSGFHFRFDDILPEQAITCRCSPGSGAQRIRIP
jgi:hypothetical protein